MIPNPISIPEVDVFSESRDQRGGDEVEGDGGKGDDGEGREEVQGPQGDENGGDGWIISIYFKVFVHKQRNKLSPLR